MESDQAQLQSQARRMTAVATLARPVQHDINNLLTVVFANLELLKRSAAEGAPQRQLDRIQEATRRLDAGTRALLGLLRRPNAGATEFRLSEALAAVHPLLALLLPATGPLGLAVAGEEPLVRLDRAALEDALLTLAQEGAEQLPRGAGLTVALSTLAISAGPDRVELAIDHTPGAELVALDGLAALVRAHDGSATTVPAGLRITLPGLTTP